MVQSGSWFGMEATGGFWGLGRVGRGVAGSEGKTGFGLGKLGVELKVPLNVPPTGLVGTKMAAGGKGGVGGAGVTGAISGSKALEVSQPRKRPLPMTPVVLLKLSVALRL